VRPGAARARMPRPTVDHRAPHAAGGGGARPTCGLADEVERVVGTVWAILFFFRWECREVRQSALALEPTPTLP